MAKNTKTPVMILQELAVKRNTVPEYDLVYSQQGTHENIFHYKVTILQEHAIGIGRSKKEAKHEAASKALELLAEKGILHPDISNESTMKGDISQEHAQMKAPVNCIPKLLEICVENRIPLAEFVEISAVGPPHCREFTYECRVASITTRAIAGSKKHSKQLAARDMLNRIINVLPEIQEQVESDQLKLTENDDEIYEKYTSLSKFSSSKVNFNSKVIEYDLQFKQIIEERTIELIDVMKILEKYPCENSLEELLDMFDLHFNLNILQEEPPIIVIAINSDTPVTIMESGDTLAEASHNAIYQAFRVLEKLIT